ncbi:MULTISPECIES: malate dehydrogenase (quinone) [unclassified Frankia]|uniref:malate dehydrogenase (quinone) n=1 Tax=unclassified Frankia TaxID=2632575 RepID=UPI002AD4607D|nr:MULTISPECIES: malate dehydrogenase (quinone) [unclassified Frankia]
MNPQSFTTYNASQTADVVLIGAGVMSATLGTLLHRLQPDWSIDVYERLPGVAEESSDPWNNAGTGHAALCELNYTSELPDGTIDVRKAININEQFQVSRQLWSHLVEDGTIGDPETFINSMPHMTFVQGAADVDFLRRRYEALRAEPLFAAMEFSDDPAVIQRWAPLLIEQRKPGEPIAATRDISGTDVDFGSLSRQLFRSLESSGVRIHLNQEIKSLAQAPDGTWRLRVHHRTSGKTKDVTARFVFVGAGGWALKVLQKSGIPEACGFALLPISGQFLRTDNPALVARHQAKVYGKAPIGAPPMSMPHLDTRVVDGSASILFGPYAGSSPKFLKNGSIFDLPKSIRRHNIIPLIAMARDNIALVALLLNALTATRKKKIDELRKFVPGGTARDWRIITAGQRAQIVKKDSKKGGVLQFGTEVVASGDGTIAGVLGASPGASTAVPIMLDLLQRCFPDRYDKWQPALGELIPTFGRRLSDNPELALQTMATTAKTLRLTEIPRPLPGRPLGQVN